MPILPWIATSGSNISEQIHNVAWLQKRHAWPGLNAVVMVESSREFNDRIERETRLYLTSLTAAATVLGSIVRSH
jgi:hypothetical protein